MTRVSNSPLKHKERDIEAHRLSPNYASQVEYHKKYNDDGTEKVKDNTKETPHQGVPSVKSAKEGNYYQNINNESKPIYQFVDGKYVEQTLAEKTSADNVMQPYIDSGKYTSTQLQTIEKRLNNKKKEEKIKFKEKPKT